MVGGGVFPPCIIITWSEFVFWGCICIKRLLFLFLIYEVPFSIFELHTFSYLVQKTRLTSSVHFFQLIFSVKYLSSKVQSVWQSVNLSG